MFSPFFLEEILEKEQTHSMLVFVHNCAQTIDSEDVELVFVTDLTWVNPFERLWSEENENFWVANVDDVMTTCPLVHWPLLHLFPYSRCVFDGIKCRTMSEIDEASGVMIASTMTKIMQDYWCRVRWSRLPPLTTRDEQRWRRLKTTRNQQYGGTYCKLWQECWAGPFSGQIQDSVDRHTTRFRFPRLIRQSLSPRDKWWVSSYPRVAIFPLSFDTFQAMGFCLMPSGKRWYLAEKRPNFDAAPVHAAPVNT